jgi:glycosyltransferase involved in cell wall biosynthesis
MLGQQLNALFVRYPEKVGVVLNMYMDAYDPAPKQWKHFRLKTEVPFFGLCITPQTNRSEGYYELSSYRGTCFLDETWRDEYQKKFADKYFEYLPDITETRLPVSPSAILKQILAFARGRKIVFMGGSIGKQKNLTRWHQVIAASDLERWCFVQVGRINRNNLTEEDEKSLQALAMQPIENLYVYDGYIEDERTFNEIISHSSVIFAVYRDFNRSSNMLTKAAYFEKPILVSTEGVMGKRVNQYKIGLCVNPDVTQEIVKGLDTIEKIANLQENFRLYRNDFSLEVVQAKLVRFIELSLGAQR